MIRSGKYIINLFFSITFVVFGYSQDNSTGSSGSPFTPLKPDSEKSLLNLKKKENPYLKKFEDKNKKNFFPDANVKEKKTEKFIKSNEIYNEKRNKRVKGLIQKLPI